MNFNFHGVKRRNHSNTKNFHSWRETNHAVNDQWKLSRREMKGKNSRREMKSKISRREIESEK